jgi:hypothetical protein
MFLPYGASSEILFENSSVAVVCDLFAMCMMACHPTACASAAPLMGEPGVDPDRAIASRSGFGDPRPSGAADCDGGDRVASPEHERSVGGAGALSGVTTDVASELLRGLLPLTLV